MLKSTRRMKSPHLSSLYHDCYWIVFSDRHSYRHDLQQWRERDSQHKIVNKYDNLQGEKKRDGSRASSSSKDPFMADKKQQ